MVELRAPHPRRRTRRGLAPPGDFPRPPGQVWAIEVELTPKTATTHPNPMKAQLGATRARLVPDPERGPWVTRIFQWRVHEKLSLSGIAQRLHQQAAPTRDGKPWTIGARQQHPGQPQVHRPDRRRPDPQRRRRQNPGQRKVQAVPREHWTWAADGNEHPALVTMELWEAAQASAGSAATSPTTRTRARTGAPTTPARPHPLRPVPAPHGRQGQPRARPGRQYYYYTCPHNPANPRDQLKHPDHVRAAIRERVIHAALNQIIAGLLSADRADMLAAILPATAADHDQRNSSAPKNYNGRPPRTRPPKTDSSPSWPDGQRHQPHRQRHARAHHRPIQRPATPRPRPSKPS